MSNSQQHRLEVQQLLEPKAVDFRVISKIGTSLALSDFRWSRRFLRYYALLHPRLSPQPGRS